LVVAIIDITLGLLILMRNKRNLVNLIFAALTFCLALWSCTIFITYLPNISNLDFWSNATFWGPSLLPSLLIYFTLIFPVKQKKISKFVKVILISIPLLLIILSLLQQINTKTYDPVTIERGFGYYLFSIYFFAGIFYSIIKLLYRHHKLDGIDRVRITYLLFGVVAAVIVGVIFNLILPIAGSSDFNRVGPPAAGLAFVFFIAYSIAKHRFLDVRLVILRTLTYSILVVFVSAAVVVLTVFLSESVEASTSNKALIAVVVSIFIVLILDPLKRGIAKVTDKIFFKAGVDYRKLLSSLSEVINREIDLDLLLYSMSRKLEHNLKIKNVSIYLEGSVGGAFYKRKGRIDPKSGKKIDTNGDEDASHLDYEHRLGHGSNIVKYLKQSKDIIVLEALERKIEDTQEEGERKILEKSKEELDRLDASVVAPVTIGKELTGIMVFGPKLSGDPYGSEDINLLQLIGPQLASALEKSRLYEEAQQFTERLKKEVAMATQHLQDTNVQLQEANKHLQQLDQAKSEFVSITSHQLRTPMTGIMGYLSMILQGDFGKVPKDQNKILTELLEESQRMIRIINLFLNVSKIESGKMELNLEPVQIEDVIHKVMTVTEQAAQEKGLKLIYKKPKKPLPKVMADKDKLGDIVLNFTDNAIKYTDQGSVELITEVDGNMMHFAVKDTGRGIDPEEAKKLFTKFVRGYGIAQVNPDGSGLGLYVARRLAEAHNGEIWVDSEGEGKGSIFNVKIPLAKVKKAPKSAGK